MRKLISLAIVSICLPVSSWGGTKEELIRLQKDVLQLQNLVRLMQENQERESGVLKSLLEQISDRMAESNVSIKDLTDVLRARSGGQEELAGGLRDSFQKLSQQIEDVSSRVVALHNRVEESQLKVSSLRNYSPDVQGGVEPDRVYSAAYNDYLMGNYDIAVQAFQDFITTFPDSEYSDNAAYYLGVSQMQQGRHEVAILAFDQVLNLYPRADKTTPAYFKKGLSLIRIERIPEAIETFRKLITRFPEAPESELAREELIRLGFDPDELTKDQP